VRLEGERLEQAAEALGARLIESVATGERVERFP
jgi:hypothetical protein